jgi:hypothetical protein
MRRLLYVLATLAIVVITFVTNVYPAQAATTNLTVVGEGVAGSGTYIGGLGVVATMTSDDDDTSHLRLSDMDSHDWQVSTMPVVSSVNSVTVYSKIKVWGGASRLAKLYVSIGGVQYATSYFSVTLDYVLYSYTWVTNPATGLAWTISDINNARFGVQSYATGLQINITWLYVTVDYTVNPPAVSTSAASGIGTTTATLNGSITAVNDASADFRGFVWDNVSHNPLANTNITPPNGYSTNWTESGAFGIASFSHAIAGLTSGGTYYFRSFAHNTYGWNYGSELHLTTIGPPQVATEPATYVSPTAARLNANTVSDGGQPCDARFGYGTVSQPATAVGFAAYTTRTAWVNDTYSTGMQALVDIGSLAIGTTYYFNVQMENDSGIAYGVESSFTTSTGLGAPTNFVTIPTGNSITLVWAKGASSPLTYIKVSTSTYPNTTADGSLLYLGALASTTYSNLTAGTTYYFSAWGTSGGFYSAAKATALGTTLAGTTTTTFTMPTPSTSMWVAMPSELGLVNFPFYPYGNWLADSFEVPRATFWLSSYIALMVALGSLIYVKSKSQNLLLTGMGVAFMMIVGSLIGMPTNCLIPIWATAAFIIVFVVIGLVVNRY